MCQQSIVLDKEYTEQVEKRETAMELGYLLMVCAALSLSLAGAAYSNRGEVITFAIVLGVGFVAAAVGEFVLSDRAYKKSVAIWRRLHATGCISSNDPRHERHATQSQQSWYQQQQYDHTLPSQRETQPLTQNSIDVNQLVQGYAANAQSIRITANDIEIVREEQKRVYDAEYVDTETRRLPQQPQRQLPPLDARNAIVRRQAESTRIRRRES